MSYATADFTESLSRTDIARQDIAAVEAAWGHGSGQGTDAGHYKWSEDGASDWCGGFLLRLKDGSYAYLTGWCDYTGWGCQDGVAVYRFAERPTVDAMNAAAKAGEEYSKAPAESEWDAEPADLNRWLTVGRGDEDA